MRFLSTRKFAFATVLTVLAVAIGGSSAVAKPPNKLTCTGGAIAPGVYGALMVKGACTITGAVTIDGKVTVAKDADLEGSFLGTRLTINGNVQAKQGATLGLGCSFGFHDCGFDPTAWPGNVTVNGNITANQALTMYLDFTTVNGNVTVNGGGDITMVDHPPAQDGLVLPIKDNVIDGNLMVQGWQGAWFGIIRNTVSGNVKATHTVGTRLDGDTLSFLDSTEIVTNVIGGNLICQHNTPAAQIGDSGGTTNTVAGNKIGECAINGL
jgi:hypothetical protein